MIRYAEIALPLPLDKSFTYEVPPEFAERIALGMRALVPFGGRRLTGVVVALRKGRPAGNLQLKSLAELPDESPTFSAKQLAFTRALSRAFLIPWGEVLKTAVPPSYLPKSLSALSLTDEGREALGASSLTAQEREVAACLMGRPHTVRYLERKCPAVDLRAILDRLRRQGFIAAGQEMKRVKRRRRADAVRQAKQLELEFSLDERGWSAAEEVSRSLAGRDFGWHLLFGPPDRRQAVYFELIRRALGGAGRALLIIPEISLTPGLIEGIERSLGEAAAVLHGGLTDARRESEWQRIKRGGAQVVVGSRLALFAPLDGVRLVICDEEQDESYSQQEGLPYDVRVAARLRAEGEGAILLYGSAAPSVETFFLASGSGRLLDLGGHAEVRRVSIVPHNPARGLVSADLDRAVRSRLERREPVILFINRRGYAAAPNCPKCGWLPRCSRCGLPLSYHKREGKFVCHYCRFSVAAFTACQECGSRLVIRQAVGIEAAAEELKKRFPGRRVEMFATDEARRKEQRDALRLDFRNRAVDILLGTQFLAHQTGFSPASLVGILHPEFGLGLADYRSAQKTYLAVRRELRFLDATEDSEAIVQTSAPDHFSVCAAVKGDYLAFYEQEIAFRRLMDYPPFSALAEVQFAGERLRTVAAAARSLAGRAKESGKGISVFGPSLAPAKPGGQHRVRVVFKAPKKDRLGRFLASALRGVGVRHSVLISY